VKLLLDQGEKKSSATGACDWGVRVSTSTHGARFLFARGLDPAGFLDRARHPFLPLEHGVQRLEPIKGEMGLARIGRLRHRAAFQKPLVQVKSGLRTLRSIAGGKKELSAEYKPSNEPAYDRADDAQAQDEPHRRHFDGLAGFSWRNPVLRVLKTRNIPQEFPSPDKLDRRSRSAKA
jgi:hypothetical protein